MLFDALFIDCFADPQLGVVPVLIGPLQALIAILPGLLAALGGAIVTMFKPRMVKRFLLLLWAQKLPIVGVAAVVGGLVYAWPHVFPKAIQEGAAKGEWPAFRGGAARLGTVDNASADPVQGGILWSHTADKVYYGSPTLVGDKLYAVSARYETFRDEGTIYCIDALTGKTLWEHREKGMRATFSSPAIAGGGKYLVCGEGLHYTEEARILCFEISGRPKLSWSYTTTSHVESSPCVADGRVYIGAGDDGYYCLALEPAKAGEAEVLWHVPGPKSKDVKPGAPVYHDCESSPIAVGGRVYAGLGIGGEAICCFDGASGAELWRIPTPYPVFSAPTVLNGKLYVGMGVGDYVNRAEVLRANAEKALREAGKSEAEIAEATRKIVPAGEVWCIDIAAADHPVLWKYPVGRTVLGAIAARGDRLYFGSRDGYFYCLSTEGRLIGKFNVHKAIITSPALGRDHVYFMTENGRVHGLNAATMTPVWNVSLGQGALFMSSPALGNGHVYIGSDGNGIVCAGEPANEARERIWAAAAAGPGRAGYGGGGVLPTAGRLGWRYPNAQGEPIPHIEAPACVLDGSVYVGLNTTQACGVARIAYLPEAPSAVASATQPSLRWFCPTTLPVAQSVVASSRGEVYAVDGRRGDQGRRLYCIDMESGAPRWTQPVAAEAVGTLLLTEAYLLTQDEPGLWRCWLRAEGPAPGPLQWSIATGAAPFTPLVTGDLLALTTVSNASLRVYDLPTGIPLWNAPLRAAPTTGPLAFQVEPPAPADAATATNATAAVGEHILVVGHADGVCGMDLVTGAERWNLPCGPVAHTVACRGQLVVALTQAGNIHFVDVRTGAAVKTIPGADPTRRPLVADTTLLYCTATSIERMDVTNLSSAPRRWLMTSWMGKLTATPVGGDALIFFATDKRGLICASGSKR
jgi:eukaryotic-like serine/threonine-protein kinase